jgi:hypothetical protein
MKLLFVALIMTGLVFSFIGRVSATDIVCSKDLIESASIVDPCPKFADGPIFTHKRFGRR